MQYLKQYEYAITIASTGGISQAADELNIAQPTLSKYIKKLETELGVELFDRSTIPIRLTQAGECFVEVGKRMIDMDIQLKKQIEELKDSKNTVIRIGISPSRSPYLMPGILKKYKDKNQLCRILIEERTSHELNKRLAEGDLDLIINLQNEENEFFERILLFEEDVYLAISKEAYQKEFSITDYLDKNDFISVGKGQAMRQLSDAMLKKYSACEPDIQCQSIESALALVRRGVGITLVPSYIVNYGTSEQLDNLEFIRLQNQLCQDERNEYKRKVSLFYRKEQFLTRAEKELIEIILEVIRNDE